MIDLLSFEVSLKVTNYVACSLVRLAPFLIKLSMWAYFGLGLNGANFFMDHIVLSLNGQYNITVALKVAHHG